MLKLNGNKEKFNSCPFFSRGLQFFTEKSLNWREATSFGGEVDSLTHLTHMNVHFEEDDLRILVAQCVESWSYSDAGPTPERERSASQ